MTCAHCAHPLYAGIRCSVCGRWSDKLSREEIAELRQGKKDIAEHVKSNFHACSYECQRPECIKAQRDELVRELRGKRDKHDKPEL